MRVSEHGRRAGAHRCGAKCRVIGQQVADITLREIAAMLGRFEPPARVAVGRAHRRRRWPDGHRPRRPGSSCPSSSMQSPTYKRVGSTTTVMSQDEYTRLLLDRNHSRHRWANQPAEGVRRRLGSRRDPAHTSYGHRAAAAFGWHQHGRRRHHRSFRLGHRWPTHQRRADALRHEILAALPTGAAQARSLPRNEDHRRHHRQQGREAAKRGGSH